MPQTHTMLTHSVSRLLSLRKAPASKSSRSLFCSCLCSTHIIISGHTYSAICSDAVATLAPTVQYARRNILPPTVQYIQIHTHTDNTSCRYTPTTRTHSAICTQIRTRTHMQCNTHADTYSHPQCNMHIHSRNHSAIRTQIHSGTYKTLSAVSPGEKSNTLIYWMRLLLTSLQTLLLDIATHTSIQPCS